MKQSNDYSKFHVYPNGFHPHLFLSSVLERWQEVGGQKVLFFLSLRICISHVTDGQAQERTLIIPVVQLQRKFRKKKKVFRLHLLLP